MLDHEPLAPLVKARVQRGKPFLAARPEWLPKIKFVMLMLLRRAVCPPLIKSLAAGMCQLVQAPSISTRRASALPALVMPPRLMLVPDECSEGTKPR